MWGWPVLQGRFTGVSTACCHPPRFPLLAYRIRIRQKKQQVQCTREESVTVNACHIPNVSKDE